MRNIKILVKAYTAINLGDDLFVTLLCQRYPQVEFFLQTSKRFGCPYKNIKNLTIIPKIRFVDWIFSKLNLTFSVNTFLCKLFMQRIDYLVFIGGSIFKEYPQWLWDFRQLEKQSKDGARLFVLGSNFGPYTNSEFYNKHYELFEKSKDVCLRDLYSYNLFKMLKNIRHAPDIVFTLPLSKLWEPLETEKPDNTNYTVISAIDLSHRQSLAQYKGVYEEFLFEHIKLNLKEGKSIVLFSFCVEEGDLAVASRLYERLDKVFRDVVSIYKYSGNIHEALKLIKNADRIISTRFHATILGWVFKKKVLPIVYSKKTLDVIEYLKYTGSYFEIDKLPKDVFSSYQSFYDSLGFDINNISVRAQEHFCILDRSTHTSS